MGSLRIPLLDKITGKLPSSVLPDLSGNYLTALPSIGAPTYNPDGSVATDEAGVAYTYNADGSVHTATKSGTTRTASYNTDGTFGGWV